MCATGNPIGAEAGVRCGLVDRLVEGELIPHAVGYAEEVREVRPLPQIVRAAGPDRPTSTRRCSTNSARRMRSKFRGFDAPLKNIEAVKVATEKPYAEGVIEERKLFMELMSGDAVGARSAISSSPSARRPRSTACPENTEPRPIRKVGVIGAGTMGGGISMNFLSAGIPVTIIEMEQEALDRGTGVMRKNYEASAAKGKLTAGAGRQGDGPAHSRRSISPRSPTAT